MCGRAVVFQVPWAWTTTDKFGRIQPTNLGGWHSMAIFGLANSYDKNLPGLHQTPPNAAVEIRLALRLDEITQVPT